MAKKKIEKKEEESKAVVVLPPPKREVVLEGDPDVQLEYAAKAANALMRLVDKKKNPVIIRGKTYLEFGDWQVLARFYGATVEVEWTHPVKNDAGKIKGYEARAIVRRAGEIISSAEGMCTTDETRWKDAEEYAVRSMAQTRTSAKALRNAFGWVAELAGYQSTPAEEMPTIEPRMTSYQVARVVPDESDEAGGYLNSEKPPFEDTPRKQYPKMDETNDAHGFDNAVAKDDIRDERGDRNASVGAKMKIARLLKEKKGYIMLGKTAEHVAETVMNATGIKLMPENYNAVIEALEWL